MTPLCTLARKHGTDKGGAHLQRGDTCHNYTPFYHELFKDRREDVKNVLEIGIGGGHSLRMWKEYFPNATIYGVDNNLDCILYDEKRITCFHADQGSEKDLTGVMRAIGSLRKIHLMIDDGSHEPAHQIFTAQILLPYLAPDGIYVIEDIEPDCQPQLIGNPIVDGLMVNDRRKNYTWNPLPTGRGIGRAYCRCGCETGEQLVVIRHV